MDYFSNSPLSLVFQNLRTAIDQAEQEVKDFSIIAGQSYEDWVVQSVEAYKEQLVLNNQANLVLQEQHREVFVINSILSGELDEVKKSLLAHRDANQCPGGQATGVEEDPGHLEVNATRTASSTSLEKVTKRRKGCKRQKKRSLV